AQVSRAAPEEAVRSPQEVHLKFGPRWQVTRQAALGDGEGLARLALPDAYRGDLAGGYLLHPGLMDLATGWAISLAPGYGGRALWVPVSYREIRVHAALPAEIRSWVRLSEGATPIDGFVSFDVTLTDGEGRVLVEVDGFQMQRTGEVLARPAQEAADTDAAALGLEAAGRGAPLSPEEQRLHHNIGQGIRAEEGAEALRRALNTGLSQVVVTSIQLPALIAQADRAVAQAEAGGQSFERPQLDTDYVAPRGEIETVLAGFFETLLGVSQVGAEDSFFDLGGHSLIAVRLFAQIKRRFDVEFPISILFEAPSVARIAERIEARIGPSDAAPAEEDSIAFRHVVPLHEAREGGATPFFIVAGMFGNVLNLRHLALMLGRERSVYGLQARGLIGDEEPHNTMEEAAADYIAEMRQ
ncbi:polyketide synthase dehydratase domain-containing protein, partial [Cribrihabitans sp. XS_ASV171]